MVERARVASDFLQLRSAPGSAGNALVAAAEGATAQRRIVPLVILLFWLLVFEGVLRKWVAPQLSQALFFIRDPVVLLIYAYALHGRVLRRVDPLLQLGLAFALLALPLAAAQVSLLGNSQLMSVVIYGWRQYFLYLPLPFIVAATFTEDSLLRFARHVCVAVIITAPVELLQFHAPPAAVINRGIAEDERLQFQSFGYTAGLVRPSGTFTSTAGVTELVASSFALLLAVWLMPGKVRGAARALLLLGTAATATCLALSGSRAAFLHCGIVMLCALLLAAIAREPALRLRALFFPLTLLTVLAVLYPIVFPDALAAILSRVSEAHVLESQVSSLGIFGRALYETTDFLSFLTRAPLAGYGLGLGGNGRSYFTFADADFLARISAESDWSRHIVDLGPIVGALFIIYRIAFVCILLGWVLKATRRLGSAFPLLLFGYVGIGLFYGQLTGHGTVGGFLWLYLGLCMAACSAAADEPRATPVPARARWKFVA